MNICLQCGKEIPKNRKFCSSSCSASYNNRKREKRTEESKKKASQSLHKLYLERRGDDYVWDEKAKRFLKKHICENCQNVFYTKHNDARFCSTYCAKNSEETKQKIREKVKERIDNGTFSGWKERNISSYPEIFWERVLTENGIPYIREDFSTKKYFLDFLIEKNNKKIDLEIDGKQHKYEDRHSHDIERDLFLKERGYDIYRVPWNEINSEDGKFKMKEKINKFLEYYRNI